MSKIKKVTLILYSNIATTSNTVLYRKGAFMICTSFESCVGIYRMPLNLGGQMFPYDSIWGMHFCRGAVSQQEAHNTD